MSKLGLKLEKMKDFFAHIISLLVATIAYWVGVSLSFLLWKASNLKRKKNERTFWVEIEDREEDYKSQY